MTKIKRKVYLPEWYRWVYLPLFLLMWAFLTYQEFFTQSSEKMGIVGYIISSIFFLGFGIMMWLMSSGKLPSYIIE